MAIYDPPEGDLTQTETAGEVDISPPLVFSVNAPLGPEVFVPYVPQAWGAAQIPLSWLEAPQRATDVSVDLTAKMLVKYEPPGWAGVSIILTEADTAQSWDAGSVNLTPDLGDVVVGAAQYVGGEGFGFDSYATGSTVFWLWLSRVLPPGVASVARVSSPSLRNAVLFIKPNGLLSFQAGRAQTELQNRIVSTAGFTSSRYGVLGIRSTKTSLYLTGFGGVRFSPPWVSLGTRVVRATGLPPTWQYGNSWVSNGQRTLYAAGVNAQVVGVHRISDRAHRPKVKGLYSAIYGAARVELENRTVFAVGRLSTAFGAVGIRLGVRYVYPTWIYGYKSGYGWLDFGERFISDKGYFEERVASRIWIAYKIQARFFQGFDSAYVSEHAVVADPLRSLLVKPIQTENLQRPTVENKNTFVIPHVFEVGQKGETLYGVAGVAYRNRTLLVSGVFSLRFGLGTTTHFFVADIDLATVGLSQLFGTAMVAYRIRNVHPQGFDLSYIALSHVRNLGMGLKVVGQQYTEYGRPVLEFGTRYIKTPTATLDADLLLFGSPWVSVGVREVNVFSLPGRGAVAGTDVSVSLGMRFLKPAGIQIPTVVRNDIELRIHFTYIKPFERVEKVDVVETPHVELFDREVSPKVWLPKEFIGPEVAHRNRHYLIGLGDTSLVPPPRIADRRLFVDLYNKGFAPLGVGNKGKIENVDRDPPSLRKLFVGSIWAWDPLVTRLEQVPEPNIGVQTIADVGVGETLGVGEHLVYSNAIIIEAGMWTRNMGSLTVSPFYIRPESLGEHLDVSSVGIAFVSPYHIFAALGDMAPDVYRPYDPNHYVDHHVVDGRKYRDSFGNWEGTKKGPVWVPRPIVTHWVQQQFASGFNSLRMGSARLYRPGPPKGTPQYISGKGINSMRMGWLRFPPDLLYMQGLVSFVAGKPTIREVPSGILRVRSMPGFVLGRPTIDYYNRFVKPKAWDSRVFGTQWASFRVRGFKPVGIASKTVIPEVHYIDYKIRRIAPEGEDYLNPPVAMTGKPTTVRNQYNGKVFNAKSVASGALGVAAIAQKTQHLAPRALFAVPLFPPTVSGRTEIQALGAEHTEFGHVRKYEEGVVYPHEFDLVGFGQAFVGATREMQGFDSAVVECPVIAKHVGAYGTPGEQFGVTIFTNEVCCEGCG